MHVDLEVFGPQSNGSCTFENHCFALILKTKTFRSMAKTITDVQNSGSELVAYDSRPQVIIPYKLIERIPTDFGSQICGLIGVWHDADIRQLSDDVFD